MVSTPKLVVVLLACFCTNTHTHRKMNGRKQISYFMLPALHGLHTSHLGQDFVRYCQPDCLRHVQHNELSLNRALTLSPPGKRVASWVVPKGNQSTPGSFWLVNFKTMKSSCLFWVAQGKQGKTRSRRASCWLLNDPNAQIVASNSTSSDQGNWTFGLPKGKEPMNCKKMIPMRNSPVPFSLASTRT